MKFSDLQIGAVFIWSDEGGADIPLKLKTSKDQCFHGQVNSVVCVNPEAEVELCDDPQFIARAIENLSDTIGELSRAASEVITRSSL